MNQMFNPSRFFKYASYQYRMRSKMIFLTITGAFIAMLFVFVGIKSGENNSWEQMFWLFGVVGLLLYVGNSFPDFRKKETTVSFVMTPVSVFEKFVFEFITRIILYTVMYPVIFYLAAHLSFYISVTLYSVRVFYPFNFDVLFNFNKQYETVMLYVIPAVYFFMISVFFAGAAVFRRYPLIKTLVISGLFLLSVFGYFNFILFDKMKLTYGMEYFFEERIPNGTDMLLKFITVILVLSAIAVLFYAYFKVKEKEV